MIVCYGVKLTVQIIYIYIARFQGDKYKLHHQMLR